MHFLVSPLVLWLVDGMADVFSVCDLPFFVGSLGVLRFLVRFDCVESLFLYVGMLFYCFYVRGCIASGYAACRYWALVSFASPGTEVAWFSCAVRFIDVFSVAGTDALFGAICCSFKEVRAFTVYMRKGTLKYARASDLFFSVERLAMATSPPRCARLFVRGHVYRQANGARCFQFPSAVQASAWRF